MSNSAQENSGPKLQRVSKLMADRGICSRREADELISRGLVLVDGQPAVIGQKAADSVRIEVRRGGQKELSEKVTILLHKPVGYVSGQPEPGHAPAVRLITKENQYGTDGRPLKSDHFEGLAPAGRLDVDSTGLLVFTQDGRTARLLIGEDSPVEKEYLVRVQGVVNDSVLDRLCFGLELDGKPLKRARVEQLNADQLRFVLCEGRKRQIRRMCELMNLRVTGLKRVRIGNVPLRDLPVGRWRFLLPFEQF